MRGRDLLLRGRGADVGVRASPTLVRLAGAALAIGVLQLADSLGFTTIVGINAAVLRLGALIAGALLAPTGLGALLWLAAGALVTLQMLVIFTPLVRPLVPPFVRADPLRAGHSSPAVVVLSGGMNDDGLLRGQALDRLLYGARIVGERGTPQLALSVTDAVRRTRAVDTERDQRALVSLLAPAVDLRFVRDVHSTRDEALAFAALARTHGWSSVTLVTSPLHSARACAAFEKAGLAVECRPADARDYSIARLDSGESRRLAFADVVYESAAWLLYRLRGWV